MNLTAQQKRICEQVINVFESGSIQGDYSTISIYSDGPHKMRQVSPMGGLKRRNTATFLSWLRCMPMPAAHTASNSGPISARLESRRLLMTINSSNCCATPARTTR